MKTIELYNISHIKDDEVLVVPKLALVKLLKRAQNVCQKGYYMTSEADILLLKECGEKFDSAFNNMKD